MDDLARKLEKQRADAAYRRFRRIQQFSHRFRFAGMLVATLLLLLSYILYILSQRAPQSTLYLALAWGFLLLAWGYLLLLPVTFAWRLSLPAYVLRKHWVWLSVVIGLPIDIYLLPALFPHATAFWTRLPLVFFAMLLWGLVRRGAREDAFREEVQNHKALWDQLLQLGVIDMAFFGFWHLRSTNLQEDDH